MTQWTLMHSHVVVFTYQTNYICILLESVLTNSASNRNIYLVLHLASAFLYDKLTDPFNCFHRQQTFQLILECPRTAKALCK